MRSARTDRYEHATSGLLTKRAELLGEAETIRDRLAAIKNDLDALDRTLRNTFSYDGNREAMMPRQKRHELFGSSKPSASGIS
ncbi:MAG: hypothetical protein WBO55_11575 [Rhizobiaceae bacterium]